MNGQKLKFMAIEPSRAPEKLRIRNTEKSNIGRGLIRSAITKGDEARDGDTDDRQGRSGW